jgi:nicotinate-nucleotide adenylyltransferase
VSDGVALFGGTFNPIHAGHLRAAEEVLKALKLREIVFIPSATPPHKSEEPLAPAAQRLAWVKKATAGYPCFSVDPLELEREGPSYTVDTLLEFQPKLAPERPIFLLGWDAFCHFDTWHKPEQVLELANLVVLTRPPCEVVSFEENLPTLFSGRATLEDEGRLLRPQFDSEPKGREGGWVRLLPIQALEVSASEIRERLRKGDSVRYLLPDSIYRDVVESGIYGNPGLDKSSSHKEKR